MNITRRRYKKQSQVQVLGPDKRGLSIIRGNRRFWLEEEIMRSEYPEDLHK